MTDSERTELVSDGLMTVPEAAAFLRMSRSKIYQLMSEGKLVMLQQGRSRRIPKRAVVQLAASGLKVVSPRPQPA